MKTILVPTDFTEVGDNAIKHATLISKYLNAKIYLLHIVDDENEIPSAREKINELAMKNQQISKIPTEGIIRIGSIFEDITNAALELNASLIIMGTHGARGIQKLIGSYAVRVISSSKVPFIVVQRKSPPPEIKNILVPIDMTIETKVKLSVVAELSNTFSAHIQVVYPSPLNKEEEIRIRGNINYTKRFFTQANCPFSIEELKGDKSFVEDVIEYAARNNSQLIAAVNTFEGETIPLFGIGTRDIQKLITNKYEIPVLVVTYHRGKITSSIFEL